MEHPFLVEEYVVPQAQREPKASRRFETMIPEPESAAALPPFPNVPPSEEARSAPRSYPTEPVVDPEFGRAEGLFRLDVGPDHLAPPLCLFGDELSEVGGRKHGWRGTDVGKPDLHLRIGECRIDLLVCRLMTSSNLVGCTIGRRWASRP
jgi:hypothetical protein